MNSFMESNNDFKSVDKVVGLQFRGRKFKTQLLHFFILTLF